MIKYISIAAILLILLFIVSISISATDKILLKSGQAISQDQINQMRPSTLFLN